MPKAKPEVQKRDEEDDSDDESNANDDDSDDESLPPFCLGRSVKLAGFSFLTFILLMSDVFVLRVMDRMGADLVSGRCSTKKGMLAQGVLLAMAMIILDFLIVKEKL